MTHSVLYVTSDQVCSTLRLIKLTSLFWSRKVFERVENHVLDLLRKGKFGPFYFFSKFMITCQKASLVHFQIVRKGKFGPDSDKNLDQTCLF